MRLTCRTLLLTFLVCVCLFGSSVRAASAGPHFTLTPLTGTYQNGSSFDVVLGIDTEGQKSTMYDLSMTFDQTKLELTSVTKVDNSAFDQVGGFTFSPIINNTQGKLNTSILSNSTNIYEERVITGPLLKLSFKTKALGSAAVNFVCTAGVDTDTNIFYINSSNISKDIIDCTTNSSGLYTIIAATTTTAPVATSTPAPTSVVAAAATATPTSATLPKTGDVEVTYVLLLLGVIGVVGGIFGVSKL